MPLKDAIVHTCYDIQQKLQNPNANPEEVLEWAIMKFAKTKHQWEVNIEQRNPTHKKIKKERFWKKVKVKGK